MSRRLVDKVSRLVGRDPSRRGFLRSSAMGATALAVAPAAYALRPTSAHAAICTCAGVGCDCNAACCDGYTDFCCLLTGQNLCPPGTVVAGWWKADGSGYCDIEDSRRPRYYLDCNRTCAPGCGCGGGGICSSECAGNPHCRCADGCHSRKADCTRFRYGQCNQQIPCVGPITCRIVTCTPPWLWDPACSTASATDNYTRWHDRPCLHEGFTDVSPSAYYREAVEWMVAEGISTGYTDDLFGPEEVTTRAHMAAFLWRYAGSPRPRDPNPFADVDPGEYFTRAVTWMAEQGITEGTGNGTFSPHRPMTRAEAVTFLWRFAGRPEPVAGDPFTDVAPDKWYAEPVAWAAETGVTTGMTPSTFGPDGVVTRAQVAAFLFRFDQIPEPAGAGA